MKNRFIAAFIAILGFNTINAQTILISDPDNDASNPISCTTFSNSSIQNFYDSGGAGANYSANETETITICPDLTVGNKVSCIFAINVGFTWDVDGSDTLIVYDGANTSAAIMGAHNSVTDPIGFSHTASFSNPSGCLTFKFKSDGASELSGWGANITCGNPPQPFDPHIQAFLNGSGPNILNPVDTGYADICFQDSILFVATGTYPYAPVPPATVPGYPQMDDNCTYQWNFSDGTTSTNDSVWFTPPNRAGYLVTLRMTDPIGQIEVSRAKVRVSTIPSFAGTGVFDDTICLGETTVLFGGVTNTDTVGVDPTEGSFEISGTFAGLTYLPDGSGAVYTTSVAITDFAPGQTIMSGTDIQQMCVTMEHSYLGDLEMKLTCPGGTTGTIFNSFGPGGMIPGGFNGGGTFLGQANDGGTATPGVGWQYCFDDGAAWGNFPTEYGLGNFTTVTSPSAGQSMSAGTYKPESPFSTFIGCPINGNWTITIQDNLGIDDGYIFEWGMFFNPAINPNTEYYTPLVETEQWLPDATIISGATDTMITVQPTAPGPHSYTYQITDNFGCTYDTTVTIHVIGLPVLPTNASTCDLFYQMSGVTAPGAVDWNLVSSPGGTLTFSADTATLNPLISVTQIGDYEVSVTDKVCNYSQTVTISYLDDPHPVVSDTSMCEGETTTLTILGSASGESYLWSNGSIANAIAVATPGLYYVSATNLCATSFDSARVETYNCLIVAPNIFTPNGDLNNNYLVFQNLERFPNSSILIYNRWGKKVYENSDYQNNWDGDGNSDGVYYYILEGPELKETYTGFVQILR